MKNQKQVQYHGKVRPNGNYDDKMPLIVHIMLQSKVPMAAQAKWAKCEPGTLRNMIKGKTKRPCRVLVENLLRGHGYHMPIVSIATGETLRAPNVPVWQTQSWVDQAKLHGRRRGK